MEKCLQFKYLLEDVLPGTPNQPSPSGKQGKQCKNGMSQEICGNAMVHSNLCLLHGIPKKNKIRKKYLEIDRLEIP